MSSEESGFTEAQWDALEEIAALLDAHTGDSTAYRVALMEIGAAAADASGAQITIRYASQHGRAGWAPAPATSPTEHTALAIAAQAVGLAVPATAPTEAP